jgi:probable F420-dependent oxidoreductase
VRVGAIIPTTGDLPRTAGLANMARMAEDAGAHSLWTNDHILTITNPASTYPYAPGGRSEFPPQLPHYECIVSTAFIAAATTRCEVGTAALVITQRNLLELAKTTATLSILTGGRLVLGVGVGWLAEEMQALGYDFHTRGRRANQMLTALRDCWTGHPAPHSEDQVRIPEGVILEPHPDPPPPILIGGISGPALRRAATHGDGWLATANTQHLNPTDLTERIEFLRLECESVERTRPLRLVLKLHSPEPTAAQLPQIALQLRDLGFHELILDPPWANPDRAQYTIANTVAAAETTPAR